MKKLFFALGLIVFGVSYELSAMKRALEAESNQILVDDSTINDIDSHGWAPLHYAAHNGNDNTVEALLASPTIDSNIRTEQNETPLHLAIKQGHTHIVHRLLSYKDIDKNALGWDKMNPLHYAAKSGHTDIITDLITQGVRFEYGAVSWIGSPLHCATSGGHCDASSFKPFL